MSVLPNHDDYAAQRARRQRPRRLAQGCCLHRSVLLLGRDRHLRPVRTAADSTAMAPTAGRPPPQPRPPSASWPPPQPRPPPATTLRSDHAGSDHGVRRGAVTFSRPASSSAAITSGRLVSSSVAATVYRRGPRRTARQQHLQPADLFLGRDQLQLRKTGLFLGRDHIGPSS